MRFPGKVVIEMTRYAIRTRKGVRTSEESPVYRVKQTYSNYQFFSVRTREEIQDLVSGGGR